MPSCSPNLGLVLDAKEAYDIQTGIGPSCRFYSVYGLHYRQVHSGALHAQHISISMPSLNPAFRFCLAPHPFPLRPAGPPPHHKQIHTHTHYLFLSLSLSYTHTLSLSLSLSLCHRHTHTHTHSNTRETDSDTVVLIRTRRG